MQINTDDIDRVGMTLTEYLSNVLRHANGEDVSVTIVMSSCNSFISTKIIESTGFYGKLLTKQSTEFSELQEGGMGVSLIQSFFPDYEYYQMESENHFVISFKHSHRKPSVLVLDDSKSLLQLTESYLADDYDVSCFEFSDDAIKSMHQNLPDVLLIDLHMPNISGIEVVKKIRQSERLSSTSIIFFSADFRPSTIQRLNALGIDDFLAKPVTKIALLQVLDRVIMRRRSSFTPLPATGRENPLAMGSKSLSMRGSVCTEQGGDFLVSAVTEQKSIFVLGDIMGHGMQAKLDSYAVKGFIVGFLQANNYDPIDLIRHLSNALYNEMLLKGSMVTVQICVIQANEFEWISAGHPNPLLVSADNKVHICGSIQPLPGLNPEQHFYSQRLSLNQNEKILFHTDGWIENIDRLLDPCALVQKFLDNERSKVEEKSDNCCLVDELWSFTRPRLTDELDDASLLVLE
jgi:sigma-B regulation protein RsbU (phosphoserine phosphatase)